MSAMEEKNITVKCSFCGTDVECSKDQLDTEKHMCMECFKKHGSAIPKEERGKIHLAIPEEMGNEMSDVILTQIMGNVFPAYWDEIKSDMKNKPTKKVVEEAFAAGVRNTCDFILFASQMDDNEK